MHGREALRGQSGKIRQERQGVPFFQVALELVSSNVIKIYRAVAAAVDAVLEGRSPAYELCYRSADGRVFSMQLMQAKAS